MCFAVIAALTCIPVLAPKYLPLVDWPQHVATATILRDLMTGNAALGSLFAIDFQLTTYMTFYQGSALLGLVLPIELACRLFLLLAVTGPAMALVFLLRAFDRSPWPALFAFPASFSWVYFMGFASFTIALPLVLVGVALLQLTSVECTRRRLVALGAVAALLFITHSLAYLILGAFVAVLLPAYHGRDWRSMLRVALAFVPSLLLFAVWFATHFGEPDVATIGAAHATVSAPSAEGGMFGAQFEDLSTKLDRLQHDFNGGLSSNRDRTIARVFALLLPLYLAVSWVLARRHRHRGDRPTVHIWRPALAVAIAVLLYVAMPMAITGIWAISPRFVPLVAMLLPTLSACGVVHRSELRTALPGQGFLRNDLLNAALFSPVLALCAYNAWVQTDAGSRFSEEVGDFESVVEHIPPGSRVFGLIHDLGSQVVSEPAYIHFPAYVVPKRRAGPGFTLVHNSSVPLRLRNLAELPTLGRRGEWLPNRWRYDIMGPHYEYVLTRGRRSMRATGAPRGALVSVASADGWTLYANTQIRDERPVFSFDERIFEANVALRGDAGDERCGPYRDHRHQCPHAEWSWVGPTELQVHRTSTQRCTWVHPVADRVLTVAWSNVPGEVTRLHGFFGVAESAAVEPGPRPPIQFDLWVDGELAMSVSGDRAGAYDMIDVPIAATDSAREVRVEVSAEDVGRAHACFSLVGFAPR